MSKSQNLLISLVSDQRMQNVLPVFQTGLDFDGVLLIASESQGSINPRYRSIAEDLARAMGGRVDVQLHPVPVAPYDPESTRSVLGRLLDGLGQERKAVINFTGGTKPMAIGAYLAAEDHNLPQLYVDTFNEQFLFYETEGQMRSVSFQLKGITIPTYLKAHHRQIKEKQTNQKRFHPAELAIAQIMIRLGDKGVSAANSLHKSAFQKRTSMEPKIPRVMKRELEEVGFFSRGDLTRQGEIFFRSGRWLEAFTYQLLLDSGKFDDILGPVEFEAPYRQDKEKSVDNEIDVMALYQGKLGLIECKTRLRRREQSSESTSGPQDALSKLKALKDVSAGLFGKGFVVTAQWGSRLSQKVYERSREYRITIIPREDLLLLSEKIYRELSA